MADHGTVENAMVGDDYPAHEQTYRSFVTLVKAGIAVVATVDPDSPAASANGTVNPSDMPITTSRTDSLAVK